MTNMIIGKCSNLSVQLEKVLDNTYLVSAREFLDNDAILIKFVDEPINVIFNNFQTATMLNDLDSPLQYIEASIYSTSKVLETLKINNFKINKIIYTSSSSVYGENILCSEADEVKPKSLHASLKVANEKLIEKYCNDNKISFTIVRIFNMYGKDDCFSVISKIINAYKNKETLPIVNNGNAIRDFIYIDDVVTVYNKLLSLDSLPKILNIGTGIGNSIKGVIDFLENHNFHIETNNIKIEELRVSTADNKLLNDLGLIKEFTDVKEFILQQLKSNG